MDWPEHKTHKSYPALYHNNKDGTFTDVTRQAGLAVEMYGMGCAVGDFDNDGFDDVYITAVGNNHLFHNLGNGKFADVTTKAGVSDPGFSTSAIWFDYDNDGKLDLFVSHYVDWSLRRINSARWMEKINPTAHRRLIRARVRRCFTTRAMASSRM